MSYRPTHEFVKGATILGAQLATCSHCGTMRVTDEARHPQPRYIIRAGDVPERDGFDVPACLAPNAPPGARERAEAMNRARAREQAVRTAKNAAPPEVVEAPRQAPLMLPHFPWYADMHRSNA